MRSLMRVLTMICLWIPLTRGPVIAQAGHTDWAGWSFDWEVTNGSGLALRNVYYNGELVLWKGDMPVIRVQYATVDGHTCGPYADRINPNNLIPISWCDNQKVCQQSYTSGGHNMLELSVEAKIGQYDLYQVWYLRDDGWLGPHLFSRGLQCVYDHAHHPYWRLDLDLNGFPSDQIFVYDNNRPNQGWGPGWLKYQQEFNDQKRPATGRVWFVRDHPTAHGVWIFPGSADGTADKFSTKDAAGRLYRYTEDVPWAFNANGHLGYDNGEDIQERDVVFWDVAHMHHLAADGAAVWHSAGPWIRIER